MSDLTTAICLSNGNGPTQHEGSETFHEVEPDQAVLVLENPRAVYVRTTLVLRPQDRAPVAVFMYTGSDV